MNEHESNAKYAASGSAAGNNVLGANAACDKGTPDVLSANIARADEQVARNINEAMDDMACGVISTLLRMHLYRCRLAGKHGWYSYKACSYSDLRTRLQECVTSHNWLGVVAYATFLLMRQRIGTD